MTFLLLFPALSSEREGRGDKSSSFFSFSFLLSGSQGKEKRKKVFQKQENALTMSI
jgi:hypothetical protein